MCSAIGWVRRVTDRLYSAGGGRNLRNGAAGSAEYLVLPILWLVATPVFVANLGVDGYGLWALANTFMGLGGVFSFGIGDATVRFVAKYRSLESEAGILRVVRSTLSMSLVLGSVAVLAAFFGAPVVVEGVIKLDAGDSALAISAIRIAGLGTMFTFIDSVFRATAHGFERYDLPARVTIVVKPITVGVSIGVLASGGGLLDVLFVSVAGLLVEGTANAASVRRFLPATMRIFPGADLAGIREVLGYGLSAWGQSVASVMLGQLDRLLLISILGPAALGYYAVCLQLAQQIHALIARGLSFVFPLVSIAYESGDVVRLRAVYFRALRAATIIGVAVGVPMFVFAGTILTLWMGAEFAEEARGTLRVLAVAFSVLATSIVPHYYLNGTKYVRLNTLFALVSGSIVALASIVLISSMGVIGAAWARLASVPTGMVSRTIVHFRILNDRRWYAAIAVLLPVFACFRHSGLGTCRGRRRSYGGGRSNRVHELVR